MTNKNIKNLTDTVIKKQAKDLDSQTEHVITINGEKYKLKIDDHFRQTKQHELMEDMLTFFNEGNNRNELFDLATPYTTLLLIKHFTSLEISDDIDKAIDTLEALIDLEILDLVLNLMPEAEVLKMYDLLASTVERMKDNVEDIEREAKEMSYAVENDEVKELLDNE